MTRLPAFGTVIAQALEDFDGERGIIKAMLRKFQNSGCAELTDC
jgi:hypothetical protein